MASPSAEELPQLLKCQTWVLKVPIHCEGCKRKVKKVLHCIDGVYTTTIDPIQQRVTVIGNVKVEILMKKLRKAGKHAEIWPEKVGGKQKGYRKRENAKKEKDTEYNENIFVLEKENQTENAVANTSSETIPEKFVLGENTPIKGEGHGCKKMKNGTNNKDKEASLPDIDTFNPGPARNHFVPYDLINMANYNVANPTGIWDPTYHIASSPYTYAYAQPKGQSESVDQLHVLNEDNPIGCRIM